VVLFYWRIEQRRDLNKREWKNASVSKELNCIIIDIYHRSCFCYT